MLELEPTRVILEFAPEEFAALDRVSGADGASDYVRKLALRHLARKPKR